MRNAFFNFKSMFGRVFGQGRSNEAPHIRLGRLGERAAAKFLRTHKYRVLARNVRLPGGEIDLVCLDPDRTTLVVVEVKAMRLSPGRIGRPEDQITPDKRKRLRKLARVLARNHNWTGKPLRIDVIAIDFDGDQPADIRHHKAAV